MSRRTDPLDRPLFSCSGEFLSERLPIQLGRSKNTVASYRNCLRLLRDYIEETTGRSFYRMTFGQTTREFVLDFLGWIDSRGCKKSTRNQRLACLKSYVKYVVEQDFEMGRWGASILSIPMVTAETPMVGWLSEDVLETILKQPKKTLRGFRDTTLMVLMYESGARVSEILNLQIHDLNLFSYGSSVRLHGKGGKTREVPLGEKLSLMLERYLELYHPIEQRSADDHVFYTITHGIRNRMSIGNVERLVRKYALEARQENPLVPSRVTPHMFRHTRATHLLKARMPLPLIGRFLGHVDLSTTNIYASCDLDMLRQAIGEVENSIPEMQERAVWVNNKEMLSRLCGL